MSIRRDLTDGIRDWLAIRWAMARSRSAWTVLCFHEVADGDRFARLIDDVARSYRVVGLSEGMRSLRAGELTEPIVSLTFDDADRTVFTNALPVLRSRELSACLYVCTRFVEQGYRDVSTGRFPVMSWGQLKEWSDAGMDVGAHTVSHIPLHQASIDRARWEILESRRLIEQRLERPVCHFAYPWGFHTDALRDWLDAGDDFDSIATTTPRDNYPGQVGKHLFRRAAPLAFGDGFHGPGLTELLRMSFQRRVLNGVSPVVFQQSDAAADLLQHTPGQ